MCTYRRLIYMFALLLILSGGCSSHDGGAADAGADADITDGETNPDSDTDRIEISSIVGPFRDGEEITILGAGFVEKSHAAPFRSSYDHPVASMNFQQTQTFDDNWGIAGEAMVTLQNSFQRVSSRDYVRLEYSSESYYGGDGYSAGVQTDLPQLRMVYVAWWDYLQADFDLSHMSTGSCNIKWMYNSPGQAPHAALQFCSESRIRATSHVGGETSEEQDANLDIPVGGGFYARPLSWSSEYLPPFGQWNFVEWIIYLNSEPLTYDGWTELRVNNQRIYKVTNIDEFGDDPVGFFSFIRFGGNYGYDESGTVQYRHYGDIYIDDTLSRVVVGDIETYQDCSHLELQVPTEWTNESITVTANQGSFSAGDHVYLFVIGPDGIASDGFPITI